MLTQLGHALETADAAAVGEILAEDVTLRVAVHDEPFHGRPAATGILAAVLDGALHDITVTARIEHAPQILMFTTGVAGYPGRADGLLVVRVDPSGRIVDLTVFLRPLAALQALAEEMGRRLDAPPGGPPPGGHA